MYHRKCRKYTTLRTDSCSRHELYFLMMSFCSVLILVLTKSSSEPVYRTANWQDQVTQSSMRQFSLQQDPLQHNRCEVQSKDTCSVVAPSFSTIPLPKTNPYYFKSKLDIDVKLIGSWVWVWALFCKMSQCITQYHGVYRF